VLADECAEDEQLRKWMEDSFNNQLLWLLVTAFELHERFLKDLYAAIGYLNPSLWQDRDFGGESVMGASDKELIWFASQVRRTARNGCGGILAQIRTEFPDFAKYEKTKWVDREYTDFKFWRSVIEYFRHLVVHSRGMTDEEDFWCGISRSTGCSMQGNRDGVIRRKSAVARFTTQVDGQRLLQLASDSAMNKTAYHGVDSRFEGLLGILVDYACLAYSCVARHFGEEPFWNGRQSSGAEKPSD
jgi:hypothetical protein